MLQPLIPLPAGEISASRASICSSGSPDFRQLWLAAHLPQLPLAAVSGASAHHDPIAVSEGRGAAQRIVAANAAAVEAGVSAGSSVMAALATCHRLKCYERSIADEQALLTELAGWALCLTSLVDVGFEDALLLEVGGSMRLFGGLAAIRQSLSAELARRRLRFSLSVAPTRLAALWLARSGAGDAFDGEQLRTMLGALPIDVTHWPERLRALLHGMGIRRLGECLRLPRKGISLRAGKRVLADLDQALGRHVEVADRFVPAEPLSCEAEFVEGLADAGQLTQVGSRLIQRLGEILRQRHVEVRQIDVVFRRHGKPSVQQSLVLAEPTQDVSRMMRLFLCRMERLELDEPVTGISCRARPERLMQQDSGVLFGHPGQTGSSMSLTELVELLCERLGRESVCRMRAWPDHRPEHAWQEQRDCSGPAEHVAALPAGCGPRPLWLLPEPSRLSVAGLSAGGAPMRLVSEPERIESGWWEGAAVLRDYYVARTAQGQFWWIYRDLDRQRWYLHGLFG